MDDLQAENGHVDIANGIVEALCRTQLSGYESRVLWALFRKTYGWHKKEDRISLTQFQALTGLPLSKISSTLSRLVQRKMVNVIENGHGKIKSYGFQKVFSLWKNTETLPKIGNTQNREYPKSGRVTEIGNPHPVSHGDVEEKHDLQGLPEKVLPETGIPEKGITENGFQGLPISASTKETITKETTTARTRTELIFLECFNEKESRLKNLFPQHNYEVVKEVCISHYRNKPPPMDPYSDIVKWFQRQQVGQPQLGKPKRKGATLDDLERAFSEAGIQA